MRHRNRDMEDQAKDRPNTGSMFHQPKPGNQLRTGDITSNVNDLGLIKDSSTITNLKRVHTFHVQEASNITVYDEDGVAHNIGNGKKIIITANKLYNE